MSLHGGAAGQKEADRKRRQLTSHVNAQANLFSEFDRDGSASLDFEEFYAMQPLAVRNNLTADQIQACFDAADANGNGSVSVDEFFVWAMSQAAAKYGITTIETAFRKYDKDGTGCLDAREFANVCRDMGFDSSSSNIFSCIDRNKSGAISFQEMQEEALTMTGEQGGDTKRFLITLVLANTKGESDESKKIDTTGWRINASTAEGVREQLQHLLRSSGAHVGDLVKLFDLDANQEQLIDDMEFVKCMRETFGFRGSAYILVEVFKSLDTDRSGAIGFDELFEFVRGRRHSLDARNKRLRSMTLEPPRMKIDLGGEDKVRVGLEHLLWDTETLRLLIQRMLASYGADVSDLMKAWDRSGDGKLSRREFESELQNYFQKSEPWLWKFEVKPVVHQAFEECDLRVRHEGISGLETGELDIVELAAWLSKQTTRDKGNRFILKTLQQLRRFEKMTVMKSQQRNLRRASQLTIVSRQSGEGDDGAQAHGHESRKEQTEDTQQGENDEPLDDMQQQDVDADALAQLSARRRIAAPRSRRPLHSHARGPPRFSAEQAQELLRSGANIAHAQRSPRSMQVNDSPRFALRQWDVPTELPAIKPVPKVGYSAWRSRELTAMHERSHLGLWLQHSTTATGKSSFVAPSRTPSATPTPRGVLHPYVLHPGVY